MMLAYCLAHAKQFFFYVLSMRHAVAKFVLKLLNFDQKECRMDTAQELLNEVNDDPEPVSYTHLDVYKRQLLLCGNVLLHTLTSNRTLAFTRELSDKDV